MTSKHHQLQQQQQHRGGGTNISPLVNSLVNGERNGIGGFLCNDPSGLCLISKGNMKCDNNDSGVYTNLVRLAAQLSAGSSGSGGTSQQPPLVTIETDNTSILIKEYDGHTVAFTVPNSTKPEKEQAE